ncbi:MAG: hypothetical protein R3B60_04000 [Candidatus Paceibacterota bacterium]
MSNFIFSLIIFVLGAGSGYFISEFYKYKTESQLNNSLMLDMSNNMEHNHAMTEIDTNKPIPKIEIEAFKDSKGGYNLHIKTTNFTFTPENVGQAVVANEGHAHIYVNGTKIARLYGEWFYVSDEIFEDEINIIEVTLNANDHSELAIDGRHIADTFEVTK